MSELPNLSKHKRTPSQKEAWKYVRSKIRSKDRGFLLWFGGVRAGKTFGGVQCFIEHARTRPGPSQYILGGVSQTSVLNNVVPYFEEFCPEAKVNRSQSRPSVTVDSAQFLIYGGAKADDYKRVQGMTADGALLDEFSLLNRKFVKQVEARISKPGALRIYTSNKEAPYGWARKEYFDRPDALGAYMLDVSTFDNNFLDQDYLDEKLRDYEGKDRDKFLGNEFVFDMPPIYGDARYWSDASFDRMPDLVVAIRSNAVLIQIPCWFEQGIFFGGEMQYGGDVQDASNYLTNDPGLARWLRYEKDRQVGCIKDNPFTLLETDISHMMSKGRIVLHDANREHVETYAQSGVFTPEQTALQHSMNYYMRGTA